MRIVMASVYPAEPGRISGGVESVVVNLVRELQRFDDLDVHVVTLGAKNSAERTVAHDRVTVHYLPWVNLPGYLSNLACFRLVRDRMRDLQPDLIHVQVAGEYAEAAAATGLPWVLTLHGIRFLEVDLWQGLRKHYRGWFIKREERRAIARARQIISISPFIQESFGGAIRGTIHDIENPIDDMFFQVPPNRQPGRILFVGRLIPRKGVHTLLKAFIRLRERIPDATLQLAGGEDFSNESDSYPGQLRRMVAEADLSDAVTFLGEIGTRALLEQYERCSVVVLSSLLETAPMVIMEAMAAGIPVVSTDAGGSRHLIEHGQTGLVVPVDDANALADGLHQVLGDPAILTSMGRRGKEIARERFHARVVAARTRELYQSIQGQDS